MHAPRPAVLAIVQARLSSVRLPNKVLADLDGVPLVEFMLQRVKAAESIDEIILAVPEDDTESQLAEVARRQGVTIVGGPSEDVLARFAAVIRPRPEKVVVRLTADCPLVDPSVIDDVVGQFIGSDLDYLRTGLTFPDGFDVEVTTSDLLLLADERATSRGDREHVMPWIARESQFKRGEREFESDLGVLRLTVDEPADLQVVRSVVEALPSDRRTLRDIAELWATRPEIFEANSHLVRDEGANLSDAQKLWRRAKRVIPGGTSLLSKRPDMHLPDRWPTYFAEAHGCVVTSMDGVRYIDMGMMGVGTSILGFGDPRVDEAVSRVVEKGVVSTLNCPEEVLLAERLVALHPWSSQARFARTGGEACAMAVRIARAASGKDKVAICGYHGWHDWYLAANLAGDRALDGHLLPGLSTRGVPRALEGTAATFSFNDLAGLREIVSQGDVGVIIMEVERSSAPEAGFLEAVRDLASENGIVLIFDECTSGFRKTLGGHHLTVGVDPDIAVFGKTLGNGYAISAVIGRDEVMDVARDLFLSSTFWTERIGPSAALAAIAAMEADEAPARIHALGLRIQSELAQALGPLAEMVEFRGLPALTGISVLGVEPAMFKTFVADRLLTDKILAGSAIYVSLPHEAEREHIVSRYAEVIGDVIELGSSGLSVALAGRPLARTGFTRLA